MTLITAINELERACGCPQTSAEYLGSVTEKSAKDYLTWLRKQAPSTAAVTPQYEKLTDNPYMQTIQVLVTAEELTAIRDAVIDAGIYAKGGDRSEILGNVQDKLDAAAAQSADGAGQLFLFMTKAGYRFYATKEIGEGVVARLEARGDKLALTTPVEPVRSVESFFQ